MISGKALPISFLTKNMQASEALEPRSLEDSFPVDPSAWVDEHGSYLFRYAVIRLRNEETAEDVVQETLLSAIQSKGSYRGKASERTWLTSILKRKIVDHYRKAVHEVPFSEEEKDLSGFDYFFSDRQWQDHWSERLMPADWGSTPEADLQESEFYSTLGHCISMLPTRVAGVFMLREMDGYQTDDICKLLGVSANNLWIIMHRARMSLRKCVELNWFSKPLSH